MAIFWRRKVLVLLFAAGMALATLSVVSEIPSTYQSQALLLISEHAKSSETMSAYIAAAREQATSVSNLEPLIGRYQLKETTETTDAAVQRLRKQIKIETKLSDYYPQFPETVSLSFRHRDPRIAQQVLVDFVSTFEETNKAIRKRTESEANWLSSQIGEVEDDLAKLGLPSAVVTADPIRAANDANVARVTLLSAIDTLNDKQYALEQQIAEQKKQILEEESIVRAEQNTAPQDGAYGVLLVRKAELGAQLAEFASQYTEKNPKVVQARTQLSEINRQLSEMESKSQSGGAKTTPAVHDLLSLERDLIRLQTDLEITRRDAVRKQAALGSLPKAETLASARDASDPNQTTAEAVARYDRLIKRYNTLIDQRDSIRKSGVLSGEVVPLFQIVDPPNLPQLPAGPNRLMLRGLALAVAIGVGLLVLPIAERRNLIMIQDHRDVDYYLGVPLLAMIPETLTPVERSLKWRSTFACRVGVVLLAAMAPASVAALKHFGVLRQVFH